MYVNCLTASTGAYAQTYFYSCLYVSNRCLKIINNTYTCQSMIVCVSPVLIFLLPHIVFIFAEFYFRLRSFVFIFIYLLFLIIFTTHVISFTYAGHYSYFWTNPDVCFKKYFSLFLHLIQQKLPGCGF